MGSIFYFHKCICNGQEELINILIINKIKEKSLLSIWTAIDISHKSVFDIWLHGITQCLAPTKMSFPFPGQGKCNIFS